MRIQEHCGGYGKVLHFIRARSYEEYQRASRSLVRTTSRPLMRLHHVQPLTQILMHHALRTTHRQTLAQFSVSQQAIGGPSFGGDSIKCLRWVRIILARPAIAGASLGRITSSFYCCAFAPSDTVGTDSDGALLSRILSIILRTRIRILVCTVAA